MTHVKSRCKRVTAAEQTLVVVASFVCVYLNVGLLICWLAGLVGGAFACLLTYLARLLPGLLGTKMILHRKQRVCLQMLTCGLLLLSEYSVVLCGRFAGRPAGWLAGTLPGGFFDETKLDFKEHQMEMVYG